MPNTKHITVDQTIDILGDLQTKADARFVQQAALDDYTLTKATTADTGYFATYQLFKGSTAVGDKVNIPKDFLVKSVTLETCQTADVPVQGYVVGDVYIDFVVNTVDSSETGTHLYLLVSDLVDAYTAGDGIDITNNEIAVVVDSSNANGLSVGLDGLAMAVADDSTTGALSSTDWYTFNDKQDALTAGDGIDISGNEISVDVSTLDVSSLAGTGIDASNGVFDVNIDGTLINNVDGTVGVNPGLYFGDNDAIYVDDSDNESRMIHFLEGQGLNHGDATGVYVDLGASKKGLDFDNNGGGNAIIVDAGDGLGYSLGTYGSLVVDIDSNNARGLSVGSNGLALAAATASTSGVGGSAGAMSAADKEKLDNADVTAYTGTGAISVSNHQISVGAASASTAGVGGSAGTMSATDKEKLDNADVTAYTGSGAVDVTNHTITVSAATTSAAGTMSAADKEKLDGIETAGASDIAAIKATIWPAA